jgi:Fe2+ or Zn2+ uptake regulation protein
MTTEPPQAQRTPEENLADTGAQLRGLLRGYNLRITPARMAIMYALANAPSADRRDFETLNDSHHRGRLTVDIPGHMTARNIHDAIVEMGIPLDEATVYRTVTTLSELGLVHHVAIPERASRFGLNTPPHHHAICDRCGLLRAVRAERMEAVRRHAITVTGFDVPTNGGITIHGSCPQCADDASAANPSTTRQHSVSNDGRPDRDVTSYGRKIFTCSE